MEGIAALGIGGTYFHYAGGTADGDLLTEIRTDPTNPDRLVGQITDAVAELRDQVPNELRSVCIACKGLVDRENGVLTQMNIQNGETKYDVNLEEPIERRFGLPLYLENDCTAGALAEYYFGAGKPYSTIAHVTIGTGIGGGIIDKEHLIRGETNFAGEVGTIQVGPADGLECFGIPGAWEAYCSGPGIQEFVSQQLKTEDRTTQLRSREELSPQAIFQAAKNGDSVAQEYLDTIARYNAVGFGTLANLYNPGLIAVGGGVALNNYNYIIEGVEQYIDDYLLVDKPDFHVTELADEIGIYGALAQMKYLDSSPTVKDAIVGSN